MTLAIVIYAALLVVFIAISALVVRHAVKYDYLSPRFKVVIVIFGVLSLVVILASLYLLFLLGSPTEGTILKPGVGAQEFNF